MTQLNLVYITTKDKAEARKIGKELLESHLAACVNIIEEMNSLYWWEGELQDDRESVLIAKTKKSLVGELIEKVKSLHSYTCPCILSVAIQEGNKDYLKWLSGQTK